MYYVGLDVSLEKHDCCILDAKLKTISSFIVPNHSAGFTLLDDTLASLACSDEIVIGLEATGIYGDNLIDFLRRKGYDVHTINPLLSKKHQSATTLRKTKTDKSDARNIALTIAETDFQSDLPVSYHISELKSLCRARFSAVKDRSALKNRVKRLVVKLFPELLNEFSDLFGASGMALLKKYPSARSLASCHIDTLSDLLHNASRGAFGRDKAVQIRDLAKKSVGVHSQAAVMELGMYLDRIAMLDSQIADFEAEIKRIMVQLDSPILSVKGIGYVLGAMILSEIGDIHNFASPDKLLAFAGAEPSIYQSGNFTPSSGKMVKRGSPFLRWALFQAAGYVPHYSSVFSRYYAKKLSEGKPAAVVRSHIVKKLVRVIFAILSHYSSFIDQFPA